MRRLTRIVIGWTLLLGGSVALAAPSAVAAAAPGSAIDRAYGTQGLASYGLTGQESMSYDTFGFQPDGSLIAGLYGAGLQRLDASGDLDQGFATRADVDGFLGGPLAVDPQGRTYTAQPQANSDGPVMVRRFLADGSPDVGYGEGGNRVVPGTSVDTSFWQIAIDGTGRALVVVPLRTVPLRLTSAPSSVSPPTGPSTRRSARTES